MALADDPRADPGMLAAMAPFGLTAAPGPSPVHAGSSLDEVLELCAQAEAGFATVHGILAAQLPPIEGVERSLQTIRGIDGNDIALFVHAPATSTGPLPGVLHLHGGAMVMFEAAWPGYQRWRDGLAASGLVVVEFRNGAGKRGPHPFPASLNDATSALRWVSGQRDRLGISRLVLSGESGGANLSRATALRANRDGHIDPERPRHRLRPDRRARPPTRWPGPTTPPSTTCGASHPTSSR